MRGRPDDRGVAGGALCLSERLARVEYVDMAAILLAGFLVTTSKLKSGKLAAEVELAAVETAKLAGTKSGDGRRGSNLGCEIPVFWGDSSD